MQGIEYEKEYYGKPLAQAGPDRSWVIRLVMKIGGKYIKDEKQANNIMIIISIIFFVLAIYNFFF